MPTQAPTETPTTAPTEVRTKSGYPYYKTPLILSVFWLVVQLPTTMPTEAPSTAPTEVLDRLHCCSCNRDLEESGLAESRIPAYLCVGAVAYHYADAGPFYHAHRASHGDADNNAHAGM